MSRCDSAAIVPNTSELLPEPETPVNTVSRRFGISTLTSLRLFSRAPCTRIRSWLSATCGCVLVLGVMLIDSPFVGRTARLAVSCRWRGLVGRLTAHAHLVAVRVAVDGLAHSVVVRLAQLGFDPTLGRGGGERVEVAHEQRYHRMPGMLGEQLRVDVAVLPQRPDTLGAVGLERLDGAQEPVAPGRGPRRGAGR